MTRGLALLTLVALGCGSSTPPCDGAPAYQCVAGVVSAVGCGGESIVFRCAEGCDVEGGFGNLNDCPQTLCRPRAQKKAGDSCATATECLPTPAISSSTDVPSSYLTCDTVTQTCIATTEPPVVVDWLKPCSPTLIAQLSSNGPPEIDTAVQDPSCAEGWCAVFRAAGASCIANGCTRACTGDVGCPAGSRCAGAPVDGCLGRSMGTCKPSGPSGAGLTCH